MAETALILVLSCQAGRRLMRKCSSVQVLTCGSRRAVTLVGIDQVNTASSVLTRVAVALLDLDITDGACVSRVAFAGEGGDAIFTRAMVAWLWYTVIDVLLTK